MYNYIVKIQLIIYFERTVKDLKYHADVLDIMGMGKDSVIVIHGGGVYGDKEKTIDRWINNFNKLPKNERTSNI